MGTKTEIEPAELLRVIDRFAGTKVLVVGDLVVDHYIWGKVERISQEAPVVIVQQTAESKRPGGAGNVVHNLTALGANVSVCGVVGDDESGRTLVNMFQDLGVDTEGVLIDRSRVTSVKTRVIARAQQVVRVDHETTEIINPTYQESIATYVQLQLEKTQGVIVSDYGKGTICKPLFDRIEKSYAQGLLGLNGTPLLVDPKERNFSLYSGATIIKPNRQEAQKASGITIKDCNDAVTAGSELLKRWNCEMVLVTLGELGMTLVSESDSQLSHFDVDTVAREVYDVSGAGDTVAAVFLLALAAKATPSQAAVLANYAAGIVVGEVGTVAIELEQLREALA